MSNAENKPVLISEEYSVIIDTDAVSYNFAGALCAYCTGYGGEVDEHRSLSDMYYMEFGIDDDEDPKGLCADAKNPFSGFVGDRPMESEDASGVMQYAPYCVWLNKSYGCDANGNFAKLTEDNYEQFNFPAPMSVGIFFDVEPTDFQVLLIKERAVKFFDKIWPRLSKTEQQVKVEGFRLITHSKYASEKDLAEVGNDLRKS